MPSGAATDAGALSRRNGGSRAGAFLAVPHVQLCHGADQALAGGKEPVPGLSRDTGYLLAGDVAGLLQASEPVLQDFPADLPVGALRVDGRDQLGRPDRDIAVRQVRQYGQVPPG